MTRALCCLIHADVPQALHYNRLIVVVAPVLLVVWVASAARLVRARRRAC
jgi:hypothetical protein